MKILIVEDEKKTGEYLRRGLTESGFIVDWVQNGLDGELLARTETSLLIILDVMLPDINGWQVITSLRENGVDVPVLFLTAKDSVEDRVKGLERGADDYLVKPFAFTELLARVRSLLRRGTSTAASNILQVADLVLNLPARQAIRSGQRIVLTNKEFSLLELLIRKKGEVLPRSLIASQVWDMNFDSDSNVIDVAIRRLRSKIDEPYAVKLIHTVRGMGYKLEALDDSSLSQ